ncbi:MAG: ribonuclease HI family protein [Actinomycetota bacterium]
MSAPYRLWTDGGARGNPGPAGIGVVLKGPEGDVIEEIGKTIGKATNNVAEYEGLIAGLELAAKHKVAKLEVYMDSLLVVQQMRGIFKVKHKGLLPLYDKAKVLVGDFDQVRLHAVPRGENAHADSLVNQSLDADPA